jgi:hypothetical protein
VNRLARVSGLAVSALTAATASVCLLLPGRAPLQYPEGPVSTSGGYGPHGVVSASEHVQRLTALPSLPPPPPVATLLPSPTAAMGDRWANGTASCRWSKEAPPDSGCASR